MPLYEYQCEACGARFEVIRKFSDPPLEVCPTCGKGPIQKLVSSPAFHLKGSGWYATDYARKSGGDDKKGDTKSTATGSEATSSGSSDSSATKDSSDSKDSGASKESGAGKESGGSKDSGKSDKPVTTPSSSKDS